MISRDKMIVHYQWGSRIEDTLTRLADRAHKQSHNGTKQRVPMAAWSHQGDRLANEMTDIKVGNYWLVGKHELYAMGRLQVYNTFLQKNWVIIHITQTYHNLWAVAETRQI